jgi:outer membrane protein assembly factor BamB
MMLCADSIPSPTALPVRHAPGLIGSPEPGWPQWRGPYRDGVSDEVNLLRQWPEGGPRRLWRSKGMGSGYAAPIVTGERIYLAGDHEDQLRIKALDLTGQHLWTATNGQSWKTPYPGARASVTFSEGRLFHLNAHGRVACLAADDGRELWQVNLFERFGGRNITWALSECLLVDGPRLIVTPGGTRALMAALDKKTGETVWTSAPLRLGPSENPAHRRVPEPVGEIDGASYASPILVQHAGRRQVIGCSLRHVFGVDAHSGQLLWTQPLPTRYSVIASTPVWVGDAVFATAPDTRDGGLFRFFQDGDDVRADKVWSTPLDTGQGGVVWVADALFGPWYRTHKGWARVDRTTGEATVEMKDLAKGSLIYADGHLYCLSEEGEMVLAKPTATGIDKVSRFAFVPGRKNDVWTHPVILDGRLYLRYHDELSCYDVRGLAPGERRDDPQ